MGDPIADKLREVQGGEHHYTNTPNTLRLVAADYIEDLNENNKDLRLAVIHANDVADVAIERADAIWSDNYEALKVKLAKSEALFAKAMEALQEIKDEERIDHINGGWCLTDGAIIARTTIEELTK